MRKTPVTVLAAAVMVATLGLTGCGSKRHCEHDATDTRVDNSYCEKNVQGYEWESDSKSKKTKKRKRR
ncbi:hypothetical protein ACSNOI_30410 [Actinomadura kijaniata]|uniref:hypothetical protein n=1 Tax=Actinomadura kijaniata TaxID=46161 RepID=UPI003F1BF500